MQNTQQTYTIPSGIGNGTKAVTKVEYDKYNEGAKKAAEELLGKVKEKAKEKTIKKAAVKKQPKAGTKQAIVNELVKSVLENNDRKLDKAFKQEIIAEIMSLCTMTQAGATTYFYNAMRNI